MDAIIIVVDQNSDQTVNSQVDATIIVVKWSHCFKDIAHIKKVSGQLKWWTNDLLGMNESAHKMDV